MANRYFEDKSITDAYAQFRITPPQKLVDHVIAYLKEKYTGKLTLAVDVGCGSGQATLLLCPHFEKVLGTDVSPEQIKHAQEKKVANLEFKVSPAESLPLEDGSTQLVTVCTAVHWFDIPKFLEEAERVLCTNGVVALFGHGIFKFRWMQNPDKNAAIQQLIDELVRISWKDYADPAVMRVIESKYSDIVIPMRDLTRADQGFDFHREIKLVDIPKYFQSMSPFRRMADTEGEEAASKRAEKFVEDLLAILGDDVNGVDKNEIKMIEEQNYFLTMARK